MTDLLSPLRRAKRLLQALTTPRQPPVDPQQIQVRPISAADAPSIAQSFPESADPQYATVLAAQSRGELSLYVALLAQAPVGLAYVMWAGHRHPQIQQRAPGVPEIYKVQVLQAQRSRGIGALLIGQIEQDMRTRGIAVSGLGVHAHNTRAKALYERLGYVADAQPYYDEFDELDARGKTQHHRIEAIFMSKRLSA
ncbi:MAG: GNAT family N-acetyltransferase [Burkholderiaceae bacterium]